MYQRIFNDDSLSYVIGSGKLSKTKIVIFFIQDPHFSSLEAFSQLSI